MGNRHIPAASPLLCLNSCCRQNTSFASTSAHSHTKAHIYTSLFATDPVEEGARDVECRDVFVSIAGATHVSVRSSSKPLLFVMYIADYHNVPQSKGTVLRIRNKVILSSRAHAYGCTCVRVAFRERTLLNCI